MENRKMNVERWVNSRLALLQPASGWRPNAADALARVHERDRVYRVRRRRWAWIAVAASLASLTVLSIPGRCDSPNANACGQPLAGRLWHDVFPKPVETRPASVNTPAPIASVPPVAAPVVPAPPVTVAQNQKSAAPAHRPSPAAPAATVANFKEFGSPDATIVVEIYTDYECPACAMLYRDIVPLLVSQYVQTGKVRLLHRDYPLQQHPYAKLAARFANAAGKMGQYDLVVNQLFRTQDDWGKDGNVDKQVAQVLAPGVMQKVRDLVQNDATLDASVAADQAMGIKDAINQTPTIIVVAKGKRQPIVGVPAFTLLQNYLDQLLK
jgi:protein-disulfide isomerase